MFRTRIKVTLLQESVHVTRQVLFHGKRIASLVHQSDLEAMEKQALDVLHLSHASGKPLFWVD